MKKSIFILMAVVLGIMACNEQDELVGKTNSFDSNSIASISQGISVHRGRLVFPNMDAFAQTLSDLESSKHDWDLELAEMVEGMTDDSASLYFSDNSISFAQPLFNFADGYNGFYSLNQQIESQVASWLTSEALDMTQDPYNHFVLDPVEQTLLNTASEVIIDGNGYKYVEDGLVRINGLTHLDSLLTIFSGVTNQEQFTASNLALRKGMYIVIPKTGNQIQTLKYKNYE
jgi:hypothetical protein